jgi:glutathione synthase/RimK-type ligase-like ATP-grasp enzyme
MMPRLHAALVKSDERFETFERELRERRIHTEVIDLSQPNWIERDFGKIDFLIYFPSFQFSANHPQAVSHVVDFVKFMNSRYPSIQMFPDPAIIDYYNDKYRQYLFLKNRNLPVPYTIPLVSPTAVEHAHDRLGYPMILKNRHGAGGDSVFKIHSRKQLLSYYRLSTLDFWNLPALKHLFVNVCQRSFYYHLVKRHKLGYPFFSSPLLAQELVDCSRDVRVVTCGSHIVEAHWRIQASPTMWKVNIDAGGIGEWSAIPREVLELSIRAVEELGASGWLALDVLQGKDRYLITEFSPVWHHYSYKEKQSFAYKADYNIKVPLEKALNLEKMVVDWFVQRAESS